MYQIEALTKQYPIPGQAPVKALDGISTELPDTGFIGVIGRNGSGKTTLLNVLGGIDRPQGGKVLYNGKDVFSYSARESDLYRNREIAFVFQDYNLVKDFSVEENVRLALRLQWDDEKKIGELTAEALKRVGLEGYRKRKITELSGGQKQRVVIARAIAKCSRVILCDEPTGNLDSESAEGLFSLFKELSSDHLVITVTHDLELAESYCQRIIRLKDGRIEEDTVKDTEAVRKERPAGGGKEQKNRFSFRNTLYYAGKNLKRGALVSVSVILLLAICFTFLVSFYSLSGFDATVAMYNTMKSNGTYTVSVTKYIDKVFFIGEALAHGPSAEEYQLQESDLDLLRTLVGDNAEVYTAYFFTSQLDSFAESNPDFITTKYLADCFSEIVAVPSFDTFHQELAFGRYPEEDDEILIYDYMAYNMLCHGGFSGADKLEDFVGYPLTDKYTGQKYVISGLLKSNYEQYGYVDEKSGFYDFEPLYLAGLQTVFAPAALVEELKKTPMQPVRERHYDEIIYSPEGDTNYKMVGEAVQSPLFVMIGPVPSSMRFIGDFNPFENDSGIILSQKTFAELYGISGEEVTPERVNEAIQVNYLGIELNYPCAVRNIQKNYEYGTATGVCGVYEGEGTEEYLYLPNGWQGSFDPDMTFRQFYVSLNGTDAENLEVVRKLTPVKQTEEFYREHQDYYQEGFMLYTPYQEIIDDAVVYLDGMNSLGRDFFLVSLALVCGAILGYGYLVIKKRRFEIGLFKSLGIGNGSIALIFGTEVMIIVLMAMVVGMFGAPILMNLIDNGFTSELKFPICFFRIRFSDYGLPCLIGVGAALLALLLPIIKLMRLQPVVIMNRSQK